MDRLLYLILALLIPELLVAQTADRDLLDSLLQANKKKFTRVLEDPANFKVQILYTQIDRDSANQPLFSSHSYRLDPEDYFYPASTIKIFAAALALEKVNQLNKEGVNKYTRLSIDSSYSGQTAVSIDPTAPGHYPTLAHYIKKMLVVSDNDAYNRLYEFLGQEYFNNRLNDKGFNHSRLTHRLSLPLSFEQNKHTNAFHFFSKGKGGEIYYQGPAFNESDLAFKGSRTLGKGHLQGDTLLDRPMDFSKKNVTSLQDLQNALIGIMFPGTLDRGKGFDLTDEDYSFLRQYLSQLPRETLYPDYSNKPDNYCKFFLYGDDDKALIPENIRIFNKIGLAYGFTIDNAYLVDFENQVEFLLTAVIYTNKNEILNDGQYEYEEVGFPFLAELGRVIYSYELKRKRKRMPDLSAFEYTYDKS